MHTAYPAEVHGYRAKLQARFAEHPRAVVQVAELVVAVLARPNLWPAAVRQARRTAVRGWWKRAPFLPLPSREYLRFRLLTQYGSVDARPSGRDVVAYLDWCKRFG